ncbi:MAG: TRAP transporter small permease subunit [Alphaproteobacteria bacterium]
MHRLMHISDRLARIVNAVGRTAAWLTLPMMGIIIFDVITRRFLVLGSTKLQEMEWHLHGALFLLTFGFAYLNDAHVRIELARERFSLNTRAWVELFGILLSVIPYSLLILWYGIGFVERSFVQGEVSSALTGLPFRWIIKSFVPVGFLFMFMAGLSILFRCIVVLFGPPEGRQRAGAYLAPHNPAPLD